MAVFKCKMCGGDLNIELGVTVCECDYCGTKQTLPRLDDERKVNLYDRANHFRRNNEFDKAMGIYEQILNEDNTDAESYWSLVLCRYGIEYVEDPTTKRRVPTVNRAQFTCVFDDDNYKSALQYADALQKSVYEDEAKTINEIQKGILAISQNEEPFDVFICYKETDANGRRTPDSVLATELYHELTREGFKVFFARITLEDKLGSAYEPYIFAALNSAKVMVVLGTKPEHFNAVWVKNEWSRYLSLIKNGAKKMLIPAYKDMDPYDLPEEFSHLQAQNMSKLGFMQDLTHGIKKMLSVDKTSAKTENTVSGNASIESTIDYILLLIEDGDFQKANQLLEQTVVIAPKHPMIYVAKLLIECGVRKQEDLALLYDGFDNSPNYEKAVRFANPKLKATLEEYAEIVHKNRAKLTYDQAVAKMNAGVTEEDFVWAKELFDSISEYSDASYLSETCSKKAELAKKEVVYQKSLKFMNLDTNKRIAAFKNAIDGFSSIRDYKDADALIDKCEHLICVEREARAEKKRKRKRAIIIALSVIVAILIFFVFLFAFILPNIKYNKADALFTEQNYSAAYDIYNELGNFKDASEKAKECLYIKATTLRNEKNWDEANALFKKLNDYKDSKDLIHEHHHKTTVYEAATCDKGGYEDLKCEGCGDTYRRDIKATGKHTYEVVDSKNATCDTAGFKDCKCTTCGHSYRDDIKATGHNYSAATCTAAAKCKTCGHTSRSALGHTTGGTKCSRCGTTTFKTLSYSGTGSRTINYTLPSGTFRVTITRTGGEGFPSAKVHYGPESYEYRYIDTFVSANLAMPDFTTIEGPITSCSIVIEGYDYWGYSSWEITIEAV